MPRAIIFLQKKGNAAPNCMHSQMLSVHDYKPFYININNPFTNNLKYRYLVTLRWNSASASCFKAYTNSWYAKCLLCVSNKMNAAGQSHSLDHPLMEMA